MIKFLMMFSLCVMICVAGTEGPVFHPLIAVDFVVLMSVNVRGGSVATGRDENGNKGQDKQRDTVDGHHALSRCKQIQ